MENNSYIMDFWMIGKHVLIWYLHYLIYYYFLGASVSGRCKNSLQKGSIDVYYRWQSNRNHVRGINHQSVSPDIVKTIALLSTQFPEKEEQHIIHHFFSLDIILDNSLSGRCISLSRI